LNISTSRNCQRASLAVVTPTLNCCKTLQDTIRSVSGVGALHLIVDSGSTDGTCELAFAHGIKVILFPKGNMYAAINAGLSGQNADWLTYLNGDDLIYSDAILDALARVGDDVDVVYGDIDYIDAAGRFLFSWRSPPAILLARFMRCYSAVPQQGTIFRRRVFEKLGGFDTSFRYSADYDFWARALDAGFVFQKYTSRSLATFRLMPTQLSQARKTEMAPEGVAIRKRLVSKTHLIERLIAKGFAAAFRVSANLDNYWLRSNRGRGLDKR
jgi:glycosyltransferase involved in cell wall biosynthesis